jgi:hypothetical protein
MREFLKALFSDPTRNWPRVVPDPVLGDLVLDEDATWWGTSVIVGGTPITFLIGGDGGPDPRQVEYARHVVTNYAEFVAGIDALLRTAVTQFNAYSSQEIAGLQVESVTLSGPNAGDGMVFFRGGDEFRLWRCDLNRGLPAHLGFDD